MVLEIVFRSAKRNAEPETERDRSECEQDSRCQRPQSFSCEVIHHLVSTM
jgi:hypothetical protein